MKKVLSIMLCMVMLTAVFASIAVNADEEPVAKVIVGDKASYEEVSSNQVTLSVSDGNLVATTADGANDMWISVALPEVDTTVYKLIRITYRASSPIGSNNTYLKNTTDVPNYTGDQGTWVPNGMEGNGEWQTKDYDISDFSKIEGSQLTGIRITTAGTAGATFELASVGFYESADKIPENVQEPQQPADPQPSQPTNPPTSDVAVIAIAAVACVALAGVVVAKKVK